MDWTDWMDKIDKIDRIERMERMGLIRRMATKICARYRFIHKL